MIPFAMHLDAEKIELSVLCSTFLLKLFTCELSAIYMSEKNCGLKQRCDDSNQLSKFKILNLMSLIQLHFVLGILKNYENFSHVHFLLNYLVNSRQLLQLPCGQNI